MPTSHDLKQDQHLADLDAEVRNLRKRIQSNVRTMNRIAKDTNERLAALEPRPKQGNPSGPAPAKSQSRRKTPKRGAPK